MGRVLITGMTGTVGRHVAAALLRAGHTVLGVSLDEDCPLKDERLTYQKLDIADYSEVESFLARHSADTLVHLAALVHVRDTNLGFSDYSRLNFRASEHLFEKAQAIGVRQIIFASTVEVYGATPSGQSVSEDAPCKPESDYARTKLLAEEALTAAAAKARLSYAILRFAPVYAAGFRLNLDKRLYLRAPDIGYYVSRGDYRLGLCSVHNIEHFVTKWLELARPPSGIYNLADERSYPIKELLERERQKGRCHVTLRLPYMPSLAAVAVLEAGLAAAGRQSKMLTVGNIRKLVRSTTWDVTRARSVVGHFPWDIDNTPDSG